ncbi:MAG: DUF4422 domain-containing protein [Lachnospiraceae bacterium]|nr:DUF4422 domain-containing protein [Lachnospiraceae bacterium]
MFFNNINWFKRLGCYKHLMIFGAKEAARLSYQYVQEAKADIDCFIVSKRMDNPLYLDKKPVKTFEEIEDDIKKEGLVIISQGYEADKEMRKILLQAGFPNIISSATQITNIVTDDLKKYCNSILGAMQEVGNKGEKPLKKHKNRKNICIYAVTSSANFHKVNEKYLSYYINYIQAGAKLTDHKICELTDDVGDNISILNPYFSELTAGYWIYKNDTFHDYVGLYHYSRGLDVTDEQIEEIVEKGIDVLLPLPYISRHEMITRFAREDVQVLLSAIYWISPEYIESAFKYFSNKVFFPGNILFAKKVVFNQYYEWLFQIFAECRKIREHHKMKIGSRLWGYYGEHLTNIYFLHHKGCYSVLYAKIKYLQ